MSDVDPMAEAVQAIVDKGELAGAAALIWRDDHVEWARTWGRRDLESNLPVERDTLFRIASMTKPVTTLAALMLLEEGRIALDEPISHYAPELGRMRVLRSAEGPLEDTEPATRGITFEDLLTQRAGLTYADFHAGPIGHAYRERLGAHIDNDLSPDEWVARLGSLPLIDQPGARFRYGHSTDLLGFLIARIEDAPLGHVLERRIFLPLGMSDTTFVVPERKRPRRAGFCGFDGNGRPTALDEAPGGHAGVDRPDTMTFESGGQGLWSTLDDYLAFARLFAEDRDSPRLVRPETLALMCTNRLSPAQRRESTLLGQALFAHGHGYAMGVAVVMEPEHADPVRCGGGKGSVGWPGAYGGWWQADPNDGSVFIFLAHNMVELSQLAEGIGLGVWQAIADFQRGAARLVA